MYHCYGQTSVIVQFAMIRFLCMLSGTHKPDNIFYLRTKFEVNLNQAQSYGLKYSLVKSPLVKRRNFAPTTPHLTWCAEHLTQTSLYICHHTITDL